MDNTLQLKIITSLQDKLSGPLKKIRGATGESAKSIKDLRDKLKGLESTQKNMKAFVKVSSQARDTKRQFESLSITSNQLDAEIQRLNKGAQAGNKVAIQQLNQLQKEFDKTQKEARKLVMESNDQASSMTNLRKKLSDAGIDTRRLATEEKSLTSRINQTSAALKQQTDQLRKTTEHQNKLAKAKEKYDSAQRLAGSMAMSGAAGVATGTAILAPVKSVLDAFAPAEDAYTQLKVAMMNSSGEVSSQFNEVKNLAVELGDRLPGTTADFINMMTMLKRQGMSDQTILGGLGESAANLAVLLKLPVEYAAEFGAKMQDALQAPESEMMQITDGLQRMFYAGVDANNILEGFSKMGPALGVVGKNGHEAFQMIAPMLAMFDQTSMAGEAAGNALRKVFQRSIDTDKIEKANDALKELKVKAKLDFTDGKGEFGGLDNMFKQLQKIEKLNSVQRGMVLKELFGDDAETLQVVNTLMGKGMEGYTEMLQKMEKQASLTDRVKAQLGTLANVSEAASGSFTNALSDIGETVAPDIKKLLEWLGELANKAGEFTRANPELVASIVKIVAVTGAVIAGFGMLTIALASVIGPFAIIKYALSLFGIKAIASIGTLAKLAGAFKTAGLAILGMGKFLLTNPIIWIAAAIAGAAYLIYKNWDFLKAKFGELWTGIKAYFSAGWSALRNMTAAAWNGIKNVFSTAVAAVAGYLSGLWEDTKRFFSEGWEAVSSMTAAAWDGIKNVFSAIKEPILGLLSGMWTGIKEAFNGGIVGVSKLIIDWSPMGIFYQAMQPVLSYFGVELPQKFTEFGSMLLQGLVDGIKGMAGQAKEAIEGVGSGVVGWFKEKLGINSPSRVFIEMGGFLSEGAAIGIERHQSAAMKAAKNMAASVMLAGAMVPMSASGMMLSDTAVSPLRFDNRAPLSNPGMTASAPVIAGGDHIEIHIHAAAGMSPQDIARAVSLELDRRQSLKQSRRRSAYVDYGN